MVVCLGCSGNFRNGSGYLNHLRFSQNADCAAIYQQSIAYQYNAGSDVGSDNDLADDFEESMFEGYGDVTDNEWPIERHDVEAELSGQGSEDGKWEEKVDNPALMMDHPEPELYEESDSDEDEDDIGDNDVIWEPPPPQVTGSDVEFLDEPEEDLGLSREARLAAEDAFRKCPVIEKYPDSRAGAPVTHNRMPSRNESYAKSVNNDMHNPWAPFSSQTDWEIAQWAKLRGSGSTAMSDLLKINGVSL
jgi:hypothetical protein